MSNISQIPNDILDRIAEDEREYDESGRGDKVTILGLYGYSERAEKKLLTHGFRVNDASSILSQEHFDFSTSTGSQIAVGDSERGFGLVVFRARLNKPPDFDVITGYTIPRPRRGKHRKRR